MIKSFLRDYGTLIGSFLGFMFTVIALFVKYWFDKSSNRRNTFNKLNKIFRLIESYYPPERLEREKSHCGGDLLHSRNIKLLKDYEKQLRTALSFISKIEDDVLNYTDIKTIEHFLLVTKRIEIMVDRLSPIPAKGFEKDFDNYEGKEREERIVDKYNDHFVLMYSYYNNLRLILHKR